MLFHSNVIPEDLKFSVISAVEEDARFLSDEELQAVLKDAPPHFTPKILRVNEIARIHGIKTSLWGPVVFAVSGIIAPIFLPPETLVSPE